MSAKPIVLVIEGAFAQGETLTRLLHAEQYHTIVTDSPSDSLDYLESPIDLVLSGVVGSQGRELLQKWKRSRPNTPFVLLTEQEHVAEGEEAVQHGAAGYLIYPFDANDAIPKITHWLKDGSAIPEAKSTASADAREQATESAYATTEIRIPPGTTLEDLERAAVEQALVQHKGNRTHAAKELGISVRTLQRKLKAWGGSNHGKPPLSTENRMPAPKPWMADQPTSRNASHRQRMANV
jgi:DNA-binding NtrC family response regulator